MKVKRESLVVRCPIPLLEEANMIARVLGVSRSSLISEAVRVCLVQIRRRGGFVVPPYSSQKPL